MKKRKIRAFHSMLAIWILYWAGLVHAEISLYNEVTIAELHKGYRNGSYTVTEVTKFFLNRIEELNLKGPELHAVITINPDAIKIAQRLDQELKQSSPYGPLFGIPVFLKDNIDTGDKMPCTAGSRILMNSFPKRDSSVATQLREAGAVILGKANLSEFANFRSKNGSDGWSGLGGQTKNPYDLCRSPGGSSSGPAVCVAANLSVLGIGTETWGSIINPCNVNGIVGIKPTVGLISRRGIIPIAESLDTAGPMARTVTDAAICLGAMTRVDPIDSSMKMEGRVSYEDYTQFLELESLDGIKIGFWNPSSNRNPIHRDVTQKAIAFFQEKGAILVELNQVIEPRPGRFAFPVMLYEFKEGINKYLASLGQSKVVNNLTDLIDKTKEDPTEMRFDVELFLSAQDRSGLDSLEYRDALISMRSLSRKNGIDKVMDEHDLVAIIAPSGSPAEKMDHNNGKNVKFGTAAPAALAGYPNINVPMGYINGLPVGLSIFGRQWSEPTLLKLAYIYEQGTQHRRPPEFINNDL